MSLQGGGGRNNNNRNNNAKRIYNLTSLNNNPILLDVYKSQQTKWAVIQNNNNPLYYTNNNNKNDPLFEDKNSLLSVTGKEVICPNIYSKSYQQQQQKRGFVRHDTEQLARNIKEIKLILEEDEQQSVHHDNNKHGNYVNEVQGGGVVQEGMSSSEKNIGQYSNVKRYYEEAIASHPVIYKQVVSAYKHFQRAINSQDKTKEDPKKRFSTNKITGIDNKFQNLRMHKEKPYIMHKLNDNDPKNDQQKKKILYFNIYREFQLLLNLSNEFIMVPESEGQYRAFVGKGNNGLLIKSILKSRPWWCIRASTDIQNCNLIWTEWKKPKYMKMLPNTKFIKKDESATVNNNISQSEILQTYKKNKKFQSVSRILPQSKIGQIATCFDLKQGEEMTKFNKKISDQSFNLIAQKNLSSFEQKRVSKTNKLINHIPGCFQLHSKKLLFANLKKYYQKKKLNVYDYLPQTYVISKGLNDPEYQRFLQAWEGHEKRKDNKTNRNIWICKPGENSNRGNGITVAASLNDIRSFISSHSSSNGMCSALIQKYMQNPFLYNKRKFDMRCYILITTVNGMVKGYWYQEGYIRTTSKQYSLKNIQNKFIHLTNDAVQKKGETYGKFQSFNKVTFLDFEKYLEQSNLFVIFNEDYPGSSLNWKGAQQKMKQMATDLIHSVGKKLNPDKKQFSFELFGLDFMLDDKLEAFIIEANSNPCIEVEGNVLGRVIPSMLENMMRVVIDPIFPPPYSQSAKFTKFSPGNVIEQNKFTLVYDGFVTQSLNEEQVFHISKQQQQEQRLLEAQIERENQEQI